jgi:hypothetical protein
MTGMAPTLQSTPASWVVVSAVGGLAAGLLLHASHRLARGLAALELRLLNVESTVETHAAQLGDACFMSEHNGKVLSLLCQRAGWGLEHVRQLPALRQCGRGQANTEARAEIV